MTPRIAACLPVPYHVPEFVQVHVYCIDDAVQPSHPLTPSYCTLNLCQHQGLFQLSRVFTSDDQNTGASASVSVLPVNTQGGYPLGLTARMNYHKPEVRGGDQEEQPHIQGVVAVQAQEGLEELSHVEGQEGQW